MLIDVALRRFSLRASTYSWAGNHVKFFKLRRHALVNPGNQKASYCAATPVSTKPVTNISKEPEWAVKQKKERDAHLQVLPQYLRIGVESNTIQTRNFDWQRSLDGLRSESEKLKACQSLLWFLRRLIARKMKRPVGSDKTIGVPNLPLKRLGILLERVRDIEAYASNIIVSRDSANKVASTPSAALPPITIKEALVKKKYLEDGWLVRTVVNLDPEQQREIIKETIRRLCSEASNVTGLLTMRYHHRRIIARINEAQILYRQLQLHETDPISSVTYQRVRNPFTRKIYDSHEEELQETLKWQYGEQAKLTQLFKKLESGTNFPHPSRSNMQEGCKKIKMKLRAVERYIAKLKLENSPAVSTPRLLGDRDQECHDVATIASLNYTPMLLTIPYRAQHYVLKDVLDRFKVTLFDFGREIFPQLMQQEGWTNPEALSIRGFEDILCKYRTWREVYELYERQWLSLRHIRNASVHEAAVLDLDRFEELLDDVKDLAYVLEGYEIEALVDGYYGLLAKYKEEYIEFLSTHQKKLQDGLNTIERDRDIALKDLAAMEHEEKDETLQRKMDEKFNQMRQNLTFSCQRIDRDKQNDLTRDLVRYALKSHMRHCLSLEDTLWAAEVTKSLAKEYAASTGISA